MVSRFPKGDNTKLKYNIIVTQDIVLVNDKKQHTVFCDFEYQFLKLNRYECNLDKN